MLRSQMVRSGYTDSDIRAAHTRGTIERIRRGAFVSSDTLGRLTPESRHVLQVRATAAAAGTGLIVSHQSAAALHGYPLWSVDLKRVHLSTNRSSGGHKSGTRHVHANVFESIDVAEVNGVAVTTPDRTLSDLCRSVPFEVAVCIGDAALRSKSATVEGIYRALARSGRKGQAKVRRALGFCDARSESVGESRTRVWLHENTFPTPSLQVELYDESGRFIARCDLAFLMEGVILEFDGKVKYSTYLKPGQSASDAVVMEKIREDELRSYGWLVVRVTWADLNDTRRLTEKLQRAFDIASSMPPPRTTTRRR